MHCSSTAARVVRLMTAVAVAIATLGAPICPALAQGGGHEYCCEHDDPRQGPDQLQTPPCGCAESAPEGHPVHAPAAAGSAPALDVPPAVPSPRLALPRLVLDPMQPAPALARPPPRLFHIETVVLRR